MLDSLMGRKFSSACKQSIKCTNSRILLIRKKKQAMLTFLKKDVADLLANGHDANAFGRMDTLIIELNQIFCYDMIEKFCGCINKQLSCLQKQRECSQEVAEAVATLIFAAARFSDLPELCDLRHTFTARYGDQMESYVNHEFMEKVAVKSFPREMKLKVMQDIAKEFSVTWDRMSFDQKRVDSFASNQSRRKDPSQSSAKQNVVDISINMKKKINGLNEEALSNEKYESTFRVTAIKQDVHSVAKDIHIDLRKNNSFPANPSDKVRKDLSSEPENVNPCRVSTLSPPFAPRSTVKVSSTEEQRNINFANNTSLISHERLKIINEKNTIRKLKSIHDVPNNSDGYSQYVSLYNKAKPQSGWDSSSLDKKAVRMEAVDAEVIKMNPSYGILKGQTIVRQTEDSLTDVSVNDLARLPYWRDTFAPKNQVVSPIKSDKDTIMNIVPSHVSRKGDTDTTYAYDYHRKGVVQEKMMSRKELDSLAQEKVIGLAESNDDKVRKMAPPYFKSERNNSKAHTDVHYEKGTPCDISNYVNISNLKVSNVDAVETQVPEPVEFDTVKVNPPYLKLKGYKDGTDSVHVKSNSREGSVLAQQNRVTGLLKSDDNRAVHLNPPYVKPKGCGNGSYSEKPSVDDRHVITASYRQQSDPIAAENQTSGAVKYAGNESIDVVPPYFATYGYGRNGDTDHTKIVEIKVNKYPSLRDSIYNDNKASDRKPKPVSVRERLSKTKSLQETDGAVERDEYAHNVSGGRKYHRAKNSVLLEENFDEDIDKLLLHYSKKGLVCPTGKSRIKAEASSAGDVADVAKAQSHCRRYLRNNSDMTESIHSPTRAVSMPPKRASEDSASELSRAATIQPDMLSPRGGRVHPRLPDYDALTAHFNALKRS